MSTESGDLILDDVRPPYPFRKHQQQALDALEKAVAEGRNRAWVVLPPGAGKTMVGLETIRRRGDQAVVFGPNTAIQSQWLNGWNGFLPSGPTEQPAADAGPQAQHPAVASASRDLDGFFTALTYQSLATFDADIEVDEEGEAQPLLTRLHPNGRALVEAMKQAGPLTLVLDECHHLLEVWGRLLQEVLEELPDAFVLGLTATPPESLTADEARLVDDLFGRTIFSVSIPAVVREGDLAPFAEMAWLTTPTPTETDWLAGQAARFQELVHQLTDPAFGSIGFLEWLDRRFVVPIGDTVAWHRLVSDEPELCDAALRMHHHGLLALPDGARLLEQHRHVPTADDWVLLVNDWMRKHVAESETPADEHVVEAVRRALPSVGYQWTRRGIRRGRSPVDRVLARSAAKTEAVVRIVDHEHHNLGERLRTLVLCDHEHASATLPADLQSVLSREAGSAHLVLQTLLGDTRTSGLQPLLVSGSTVAGAAATLTELIDFVGETDPGLADRLSVATGEPEDDRTHPAAARIEGPWRSRQWVRHVTRFFEAGRCQVLVGTRGLLGEGWDARSVTGLVDLTAATTATSVVQTRGRALRVDPHWPDKVALNWTVVCVAEEHPKGANDWARFVRKHTGYFGVDEEGDIVDGVAHVDPLFSPYAPPPAARFDTVNARMLVRSEDRDAIRQRWRVGEEYDDVLVHTARLVPARRDAVGTTDAPAVVVMQPDGPDVRDDRLRRPGRIHAGTMLLVAAGIVAAVAGAAVIAALALVAALVTQTVISAVRGREVARVAARPPSVEQVARAVADALRDVGLSPVGAEGVQVDIDQDGEYRCFLSEVTPEVSERFATALDEVVSPMSSPRYVVPRWVSAPPEDGLGGLRDGWRAARGRLRPTGEVWHSVPTVLGTKRQYADRFAESWDRWVGGGPAVHTGSPEGEGVLVTHRGSDPFAITTVLRTHWR